MAAAAALPEAQGALSPPAVTHPRGFPRLASTYPSNLGIQIFETKHVKHKYSQSGEAGITSTCRFAVDCRQPRCHRLTLTGVEAPNTLLILDFGHAPVPDRTVRLGRNSVLKANSVALDLAPHPEGIGRAMQRTGR